MDDEKAELIAHLEELVIELKRGDRSLMTDRSPRFEIYNEVLNEDGCYYRWFEINIGLASTEKGKRLAQ